MKKGNFFGGFPFSHVEREEIVFPFSFSTITLVSFTDILKRSKKEKFFENFEITSAIKKAFRSLKIDFFVTSVLLHFDFKRKIDVKTNASKFEIFDIINQLIEFTDQ